MQADPVVLLEAGNVDVSPSWLKPGAVVISCEPNLGTGLLRVSDILILFHAKLQ